MEGLITIGGILGGLITFAIGIKQYADAQKWKRLEFAANAVKEWENLPGVRNVFLMLDWNRRKIELFPDEEEREKRFFTVDDDLVFEALKPHQENSDGNYSVAEARIRENFDTFFTGLGRFQNFIESGLVRQEDFQPYLRYWLRIIGDMESGRKSREFVCRLWEFIEAYDYQEVIKLLAGAGFPITIKKP